MEETQTTVALARERVARLLENWDWPDPVLLEEIVALGEAAIPAIQDALTPELVADSDIDDQASAVVYYLMGVLGELPTPQAIPLLAGLFSQVPDDLIDSLPDAIYLHGPAAVEALLPVMTNAALRHYPRTLAAEVAINLAGQDAALRAKIADALRPQLAAFVQQTEPLSDEEVQVVSWFIDSLAELADPDARPLIEAAFSAGLVDTDIVDEEFVREAYDGSVEAYLPNPMPFLKKYRSDYERYQRELRQERQARLLFEPLEDKPQPVVLGPRLGRNDPCWCGSGKKYKKCHLIADEKEGR